MENVRKNHGTTMQFEGLWMLMIQIYRFWLAFTKFPWLMIAYSFYPQMRDSERNNLNMTWFFQMSDFGHCWPILAPSAPNFCSKQTSKKLLGCCRGHGGMIPPDLLSNLDGIEKERCPNWWFTFTIFHTVQSTWCQQSVLMLVLFGCDMVNLWWFLLPP